MVLHRPLLSAIPGSQHHHTLSKQQLFSTKTDIILSHGLLTSTGLVRICTLKLSKLVNLQKKLSVCLRWSLRLENSSHHCRLVAIVGLFGSLPHGSKFIILGFLLSGSTTLAADEIVPPSEGIEAICSAICSSSSCCVSCCNLAALLRIHCL